MPRRPNQRLQLIALAMGLLILLAAGFAAQRSLHHCRGAAAAVTPTCCHAAAEVASAGAKSCCAPGTCHCLDASRGHARSSKAPLGEVSIERGGCDSGCCVTIDVSFETGPLPKADSHDEPFAVTLAFAPLMVPPQAIEQSYASPFATGPPRTDQRLALRRTTQLLI